MATANTQLSERLEWAELRAQPDVQLLRGHPESPPISSTPHVASEAGLHLPLRYCRQCLPAQSISRACAREAGQGGNARHKNTAETKSCNCKWPLTNNRPHLLVVFEVCRQRPVPVPLIPHPGAHQRWNAERLSLPQGHAVMSQNQVCGMGGGCLE